MKHTKISIAFFATLLIAACNKNDNNSVADTSPSTYDKTFLTQATYANIDEIGASQMALSKSSNDSVKSFAHVMITDHTNALQSLDSLGAQFSIALPTTADSMHQVTLAQLASLSGHDFDTAYVHGQVQDHTNTIALFQGEAASGHNAAIIDFANKNLPTLQMHLQAADSLSTELH